MSDLSPHIDKADTGESDNISDGERRILQDFANESAIPVIGYLDSFSACDFKHLRGLQDILGRVTTLTLYVRSRCKRLALPENEQTSHDRRDRSTLESCKNTLPKITAVLDHLAARLRGYGMFDILRLGMPDIREEIRLAAHQLISITHPEYKREEREVFQNRVG